MRAQDEQRRPGLVGAGGEQRRLEGVAVVTDLAEVLDVPAVGLEATADVVGVGQLGLAVDGDPVVVVDADEPAEPEVAGERRRLVADALHEAPVAGDHVGVVVDEVAAEALAEDPLGDRHADRVTEALPERAGGDLDAVGVAGLRMAGRARVVAAEGLDVGELEAVAGEVEHRVLEDRGVAVGEHEAVAVGPVGVGGVVLEDPAVEDVGQRGEGHRRALVPALGPQRGVHGEATDEVDGLGLDVGGEGRGHRADPTQRDCGGCPARVCATAPGPAAIVAQTRATLAG